MTDGLQHLQHLVDIWRTEAAFRRSREGDTIELALNAAASESYEVCAAQLQSLVTLLTSIKETDDINKMLDEHFPRRLLDAAAKKNGSNHNS